MQRKGKKLLLFYRQLLCKRVRTKKWNESDWEYGSNYFLKYFLLEIY